MLIDLESADTQNGEDIADEIKEDLAFMLSLGETPEDVLYAMVRSMQWLSEIAQQVNDPVTIETHND